METNQKNNQQEERTPQNEYAENKKPQPIRSEQERSKLSTDSNEAEAEQDEYEQNQHDTIQD